VNDLLPKSQINGLDLSELERLNPEQLGEVYEFLAFRWCQTGLRSPESSFSFEEITEGYALRLIAHFADAFHAWQDYGLVSEDNLSRYLRPVVALGLWEALSADVRESLSERGVDPSTVPLAREPRPERPAPRPAPKPEPPVLEDEVQGPLPGTRAYQKAQREAARQAARERMRPRTIRR
jgi:hypothetical protein